MSALKEIPVVINMVRRLSQEEGLKDHEIGIEMNISRETVQRIRKASDIASANLNMRKDKKYTCLRCETVDYVRRNERKPVYCVKCAFDINNNIPLQTKQEAVRV